MKPDYPTITKVVASLKREDWSDKSIKNLLVLYGC